MSKFTEEIEVVINRHSMENGSNTPDFILAEFLTDCLKAWDKTTKARDNWYSVHLEPTNSHFYRDGKVREETE